MSLVESRAFRSASKFIGLDSVIHPSLNPRGPIGCRRKLLRLTPLDEGEVVNDFIVPIKREPLPPIRAVDVFEEEVLQVAEMTTGLPIDEIVTTRRQGAYVGHCHVSRTISPCAGTGENREISHAFTLRTVKALLLNVMLQTIGIRCNADPS